MTATVYTKAEITEMISRQYLMHNQSIIDHIINGLIDLSDEEVMREFKVASQGTNIIKVENGFLVEFVNVSTFLSELWLDLASN
jgi:hypothetical protein